MQLLRPTLAEFAEAGDLALTWMAPRLHSVGQGGSIASTLSNRAGALLTLAVGSSTGLRSVEDGSGGGSRSQRAVARATAAHAANQVSTPSAPWSAAVQAALRAAEAHVKLCPARACKCTVTPATAGVHRVYTVGAARLRHLQQLLHEAQDQEKRLQSRLEAGKRRLVEQQQLLSLPTLVATSSSSDSGGAAPTAQGPGSSSRLGVELSGRRRGSSAGEGVGAGMSRGVEAEEVEEAGTEAGVEAQGERRGGGGKASRSSSDTPQTPEDTHKRVRELLQSAPLYIAHGCVGEGGTLHGGGDGSEGGGDRAVRRSRELFRVRETSPLACPASFDVPHFVHGVALLLRTDHVATVCQTLTFLYNELDLFVGDARKVIVQGLVLSPMHFFRMFCHWSVECRVLFHHVVVYKVFRVNRLLLPCEADKLLLSRQGVPESLLRDGQSLRETQALLDHEALATDMVLCSQLDVLLLALRRASQGEKAPEVPHQAGAYAQAALDEFTVLLAQYYKVARASGPFSTVYGPKMEGSLSSARVHLQ